MRDSDYASGNVSVKLDIMPAAGAMITTMAADYVRLRGAAQAWLSRDDETPHGINDSHTSTGEARQL